MDITINGLQLGEATSYKIASPVEGLEMPSIRTSQSNYSGRDGGRVNGQFYSPRLITVSGFIRADTCSAHEQARIALQDALPIRTDLDTTIETFSGEEYVATTRLMDFKMPITHPKTSSFKIDLIASDPFFYTGDETSAVITREVGGGFILPVILPITFDPGSGATSINNTGTVVVYPRIEIVGSSTNPTITKTSSGEKVDLTLTMSGGDTLIIDLAQRTITLNGGSVLSLRSSDSDWFGLDPGVNLLTYTTDNGSDTGVATIYWRTAVMGI